MTTISMTRLSDKTLAKYEQLEREGKLTKRQAKALSGHRMLSDFVLLGAIVPFAPNKRKVRNKR